MVSCKDCGCEGYGIDMVSMQNGLLCTTCAAECIKELEYCIMIKNDAIQSCDDKITDQKKKIKKLKKKIIGDL